MDIYTIKILNLSDSDYFKLLKSVPQFEVLYKMQFVNDLKERMISRINLVGPSLNLSHIHYFFPTLKKLDDTIKNPFYLRCFTSPNGYAIGYQGFKEDAFDKGFSSFPKLGVNLWILIYDPENDKKAFMFIQVENHFEFGTKHGMLLHMVTQTFPTLKIISAGELLVTKDEARDYYNLLWNASSGTITKTLFDEKLLQLSFLSLIYPEIDFGSLDLRFRPFETLVNKISVAEFQQPLKHLPLNVFIPIYENVILALLQNFLSKIIMNTVIPYAFPNVPTESQFQYLQPDVNKPIQLIMPKLIVENNDITVDMAAKANCSNPVMRNNFYVFDNVSECKQKIQETPLLARHFCPM